MTRPGLAMNSPCINPPMNSILTCTDGSVYSPSIYDHTAWAATRCEAAVHLLHALDPHRERAQLADLSGNLTLDTGAELLGDLVKFEEEKNRIAREQGRTILEAARSHLEAAGVREIKTEQLHGELVETVTRLESRADLVVMGKRGQSADFATLHLGSNLERVIRGSIRPVLVASRQFKPIERFLIAYDGGPSVEKAVRYAVDSPLLRGLGCHLLRAGRIDSKAEWFLQEAAGKLREAGYAVTAEARPGHPDEVISELVKSAGIDLLVMGAYGHSRIRQLMVGSTTTAMVRSCQIPVLMFR